LQEKKYRIANGTESSFVKELKVKEIQNKVFAFVELFHLKIRLFN
jgi:hypothetical protein